VPEQDPGRAASTGGPHAHRYRPKRVSVSLDRGPRGTARITLSRPDARNAFDAELVAQLTECARAVPAESRAVVLASEGDVFCAGADLEWMRSIARAGREEQIADSRRLAEMFAALDALPMPLIVRVQGAAYGGGVGLVAVGDVAVASAEAMFAFTEVRFGILPSVVSPYVVRKTGPAFATSAFVTGMRFDAKRAYEVGLVQSVVQSTELDAALERYVEAISLGAPGAVREAKRLVRDVLGRPPAETRDLTIERIARARTGEEGQEGMRAFLEKRKPRWTE
jgi:methylglutaconyl-CoA hydratase